MIDAEFKKRFLTNTDASGRYIIESRVTSVIYYVEPIDNHPEKAAIWGDWTPDLKNYTGSYGRKNIGSVTDEYSMVTKENGFEKIHNLEPGVSPNDYVDKIDKELEEKIKKENNGHQEKD